MSAEVSMIVEDEEKKSTDSAHQDGEALSWSGDDPEKAYVREMLQEQHGEVMEVDSILGGNTLDEIYAGRERTETEDSFLRNDPNAPMRLAILGQEDDLSTLAGDTISGSVVTEGAVFSNANLPYAITTKPIQRDFKEYELKTPDKQKKRRWHPYINRDDDEDTQPETPPGLIGMPGRENKPSEDDESAASKENDASTFFTYVSPSKKVYLCAAVIGAILILSIGGLAIAYIQIKDDGSSSSSSQSQTSNQDTPFAGFNPDQFSPVTVPTLSPARPPIKEGSPTAEPSAEAVVPTKAPVPVPVDIQLALVDILAANGVDVTNVLAEEESPQYRALRWVAGDPNYSSYTEPRLIQRWTLAVVGMTFTTDEGKVNSAGASLPGWMEYDVNECEWFTTGPATICNGFGYYQALELSDQQFYGTIPTEIALLSGSLSSIDLRGNMLTGTLPTELGLLTAIELFHAGTNRIQGTIPSEFGNLSSLSTIGLARNELTGSIPPSIGNSVSLTALNLGSNFLNGTIPVELGNLPNMLRLILDRNELSGTVPAELGNLVNLQAFDIGFNELSGQVPWQICDLTTLKTFEADCDLVACACCTTCAATASPTPGTSVPTLSPTASPTDPTQAPSPFPTTPSPTQAPTTCAPFIEFTGCFDIGDDIEIRFQNCDPQFGDWIGIYNRDADPLNLQAPFLWVWSCGSQNCRGSPTTNTVTLGQDAVDTQNGQWPLAKDQYIAYMIRNSGGPYAALISSQRAKIDNNKC